jgi:hypothetical protein
MQVFLLFAYPGASAGCSRKERKKMVVGLGTRPREERNNTVSRHAAGSYVVATHAAAFSD